ncbi:MAG: LytTR family DNA-binding domain-containing protein [Bacteroidota bacterium]
MKHTVLIVDDEEDARELLKVHLRRHPDLEWVAEASNGAEALDLIKEHQPDIVLLDIQMPEMNGIEVVENTDASPLFVFITAYDQFAIKAFELHALDYLLKPVSNGRFDQTMERITAALQLAEGLAYKETTQQVASTLTHQPGYLQRFTYRSGLKTLYIPTEEVSLIASADQYVEVHRGGNKYLLRLSMDYLEQVLDPAMFFRTHRSYLVKLAEVESIEQYEPRHYLVHLKGGLQAKLARDKRDELNRLLTGRA